MGVDPANTRALAVLLDGERVGVITRIAGDRTLFAFDEVYAENAGRPTLSLGFKGAGNTLVTRPQTYTARVAPFFSNLLPEGHLRDYLATRAGIKPEREFLLLAALGEDLPGAVVVTPLDAPVGEPKASEAVAAGSASQSLTNPALRFSLAGVQLKFSAIQETTGGLTIPADGMGGSWIVKLPSTRFAAVPENEFAMLELARKIGISVPSTRLIPIGEIGGLPDAAVEVGGNVLAVERFDRGPGGRRIHMEDFAQVFGLFPDDKYRKRSYASIAAVLAAETGEAGVVEFLRRLVFSVVIGNGDMHLKNWSLLYPDRRTPVLSPAYDFVSTVAYLPADSLGLGFGGSTALSGVTREQLRRFADTARLPVNPLWNVVRETVEATFEAWQRLEAREALSEALRDSVSHQIERAAVGTER